MHKDSVVGTLVVALLVCVFCSLLVSGAAVSLKDRQAINKALDIKKNLLLASGLITEDEATPEHIEKTFATIRSELVYLETGQVVTDVDTATFDQRKAAKDSKQNTLIASNIDTAGIKRRSKIATVYTVQDKASGQPQMYIFPVHGKGLWSTMYGFLALDQNFDKIKGIGFYEHAETPGLGGEVDNPKWKASWNGKKLFDDDLDVKLKVVKGSVSPNTKNKDYKIDGLSGATITSNGVTGLVRYWFGKDGFGPYIQSRIDGKGLER